jgi:putative membrane protein
MARPFLTDEAKRALLEAVRTIEAHSSAELVVSVRPQSGSYLHADLIGGIVAALAALAFLLFSPWEFRLVWFVLDPLLAGTLVGFVTSSSPALRRLLTRRHDRIRWVDKAAAAEFIEKRIHRTVGRTGMLLYISLLEREAALVVDLGVETLAQTEGWRHALDGIQEAVRSSQDGIAVAEKVKALAPILAPALVRSAEDVDELADEVCER